MMTLDNIKAEIVKRADEMFSVNTYLERAEAHFFAVLTHLVVAACGEIGTLSPTLSTLTPTLSRGEGGFTEQDFPCLVVQEKLVLGDNCSYPDADFNKFSLKHNILRPLGVYHFSSKNTGYRHAQMITDTSRFNYIINHPLVKDENVMYVHFVGEHVVVFPFREDCYLKYVRKFGIRNSEFGNDEMDAVFTGDMSESFSLSLLYKAIELAVIGVKNEVVVQEGV